MLGAKLQEQAPVVIAVAKSMFAKNSFPQLGVSAHPSIEIAKDDQLVLRVYACDDSANHCRRPLLQPSQLAALDCRHWPEWQTCPLGVIIEGT